MKLILEAIKSLLRSLKNSIHVTQKAVADVDAKANSAKEAAYYAEDVANEAYGRAINAQETASNAQTTASNAQAAVEDKLDNLNPSGTGVFSMNRKANTTIGSRSTAMGNTTTASGTYATAMGDTTTSSGRSSTAMGNTTTASGNYSIAMGNTTKAQRRSQHVQGEFNLLDTYGSTSTRGKYAHIVGNGTSDTARSNAHTLDWNGLGWFAGGLKVGGTSQDDANAKEVATKGDKLPNPNALTFTGAVEGTYDGSAPMEIEIPEGGSGGGSKPTQVSDVQLATGTIATGTVGKVETGVTMEMLRDYEAFAVRIRSVNGTGPFVQGNTGFGDMGHHWNERVFIPSCACLLIIFRWIDTNKKFCSVERYYAHSCSTNAGNIGDSVVSWKTWGAVSLSTQVEYHKYFTFDGEDYKPLYITFERETTLDVGWEIRGVNV